MKMMCCIVGTLVALFAIDASVQMVRAQTGWERSWSAKSENACYKCCRRWQAKMGWSPSRLEVCTQKCIVGTGRNC